MQTKGFPRKLDLFLGKMWAMGGFSFNISQQEGSGKFSFDFTYRKFSNINHRLIELKSMNI